MKTLIKILALAAFAALPCGCGQILVSIGIDPYATYERRMVAADLLGRIIAYLNGENLKNFEAYWDSDAWSFDNSSFYLLIYSDGEHRFSEKQISDMKALIPPGFPSKKVFIKLYNKNLPEAFGLPYSIIRLR